MTTGEKLKLIGYWTHKFALRKAKSESGRICYYASYVISADMDCIMVPMVTHDYDNTEAVLDAVIVEAKSQAMHLCDVPKESR